MKLKIIREQLGTYTADQEILEHSRIAKVGNRLVQLAVLVRGIEPALVIVVSLFLLTTPAHAQDIFGQNNQAVGNGVREAVRWGRNLLFLLGVGGVGWGAVNYMMEKAFMKQMIGGGLSMGLGAVASLLYSFSQGNAVDLDTNLGN